MLQGHLFNSFARADLHNHRPRLPTAFQLRHAAIGILPGGAPPITAASLEIRGRIRSLCRLLIASSWQAP
jgi:hypothetical protein